MGCSHSQPLVHTGSARAAVVTTRCGIYRNGWSPGISIFYRPTKVLMCTALENQHFRGQGFIYLLVLYLTSYSFSLKWDFQIYTLHAPPNLERLGILKTYLQSSCFSSATHMLFVSRRGCDVQMRIQRTGLSRDKEMHGYSIRFCLHMDLKQDSEFSSLTHIRF